MNTSCYEHVQYEDEIRCSVIFYCYEKCSFVCVRERANCVLETWNMADFDHSCCYFVKKSTPSCYKNFRQYPRAGSASPSVHIIITNTKISLQPSTQNKNIWSKTRRIKRQTWCKLRRNVPIPHCSYGWVRAVCREKWANLYRECWI